MQFLPQFPLLRLSLREQKQLGTRGDFYLEDYQCDTCRSLVNFQSHILCRKLISIFFFWKCCFFIPLSCFQSFPSQHYSAFNSTPERTHHFSWRKYLCLLLQYNTLSPFSVNISSVRCSRGHRLQRQAPPSTKNWNITYNMLFGHAVRHCCFFFQRVQRVNALQSQSDCSEAEKRQSC